MGDASRKVKSLSQVWVMVAFHFVLLHPTLAKVKRSLDTSSMDQIGSASEMWPVTNQSSVRFGKMIK